MTAASSTWTNSTGRALALGLGAFLALGELRALAGHPLADSPLPHLPAPYATANALALALLCFVAAGSRGRGVRLACALVLGLEIVLHGLVTEPRWMRALALLTMALLLAASRSRGPLGWKPALLALLGGAAAWPLLLILEAGRAGPREDAPAAEAVVVLGARTWADGRPSLALTDRVRTGAQLVLVGQGTTQLLLSGGPGDGEVHETEAMATLARGFGVDAARIHLDPEGLDTRATARNSAALAARMGWTRISAVSHAYHVPRLRQAFLDAGLPARGVAAVESRRLARRFRFVTREVAAWWVYWLRGFRPA